MSLMFCRSDWGGGVLHLYQTIHSDSAASSRHVLREAREEAPALTERQTGKPQSFLSARTSTRRSPILKDCVERMSATPPHNFSWVENGLLAGMALPRLPAHYKYLYQNGIRHLVTLTENKPPYHDTCPGITLHRIRIMDFCPPSLEQIKNFLKIVEEANDKGEGVAVHCLHGFGRTGTMLACYLVKSRKITGVDAINEIRKLRRGSIETTEQEKSIIQFHHHIK